MPRDARGLVVTTRRDVPAARELVEKRQIPVFARHLLFVAAWVMTIVAMTVLIVVAWDRYVGPDWLKAPSLVAGLSALVCGVILWASRPDNPLSVYLLVFGVSWYVGIFQALPYELPYAIGFVFYHVNAIVLAHLALILPHGRLESWWEVALLTTMYISTPGIQLLRYLEVRDQVDWSQFGAVSTYCSTWAKVGTYTAIPLLILAVTLIVRRWLTSTPVQRRSYLIFWMAAAGLGVVALLAVFAEFTRQDLPQQLALLGYVVTVIVAPIGVVVGTFGYIAAVPDAVGLLASTSDGDLSDVIGRAVGDPTLQMFEWSEHGWLDDRGQPAEPRATPQSAVTVVTGPDGWIALLVHDRTLSYQPSLVYVCAGMAVALLARRTAERHQRQAQLEANARWMEGQFIERERVQESLHDQTQVDLEQLKELVIQLREEWPAGAGKTPETLCRLDRRIARHGARLRAFVRDLYPVQLRLNGLLYAVRELLMDMPFTDRVDIPQDTGWPDHVEVVAYFTIAEAVANVAKHAHATNVTVKAHRVEDSVVVEVVDDGVGGAVAGEGLGLTTARARAEAAGGTLEIHSPPKAGTRVRLTLPLGASA